MDPKGFIRWQAVVSGGILVAAAVLGHPVPGLVLGAFIFVAGLLLELRYLSDARGKDVSPARRETDWYARQCWFLGGGIPVLVAVVLLATHEAAYRGYAGLIEALAIVEGLAFAVVIVSGLVDWYVILPRIAGEICKQPCRSSGEPQWKGLTRLWYIHRGVAAVAQVVLWLAAIPAILSLWLNPNQVGVVVAVVGVIAPIYLAGLARVAPLVLHPSFYVGDLVHLLVPGAMVEGYLVDVSIEGVKIKETSGGSYTGKPFGPDKQTYKIDSTQLSWVGENEHPFHGCDKKCSGVNWYCRHNPRAYAGRGPRRAVEQGREPV